ncbi:hypothetical protein F4823DRAFT_563177 [Ustulina deusta]|nr:hypothetical protein F4823DRAFT_563177 [Ustulina deusta]
MLLIGSSAPPKRREKNQSKTRRSRENSRATDKTFKNDSIFSEEAFYGDSKNQIAYKGTDQSGDEPVTTATPISTKSVAPTNEPQSFSKELYPLGFHAEVTGAPESLASSGDCSWAFRELEGQYFAPDLPKHMTQIAERQVYTLPQEEGLRTLEFGAKPIETIMAMDFDPSTPVDFPYSNWSFDHLPIASSLDSTSGFDLGVKIINDVPTPNISSGFSSPITTVQASTDSPQIQQTGFFTYPEQDITFDCNENHNDEIDISFDPSFCDQFQNQGPSGQKGGLKRLVSGCSDLVERREKISKISPSPQLAASKKSCGKRPSWSGNEGGGGEHSCDRRHRDSGRRRLLACPFYKKNPQRYQICSKYILRRIKDVKQHIYRHHCKPELDCPRCSQNFKCSSERDNHIWEGCILKEVPNFDSIISDSQKTKLRSYGSRGMSIEQQWMELWKVIFPGAKLPRSPHIENDQTELLSCLRSYWEDNAGEIFARSLGEQETKSLSPTLIRRIGDIILDHFETNSTSWDTPTNRDRSGMSEEPLASETWLEDMVHSWQLDVDQQPEIDFASPTTTSSPVEAQLQ